MVGRMTKANGKLSPMEVVAGGSLSTVKDPAETNTVAKEKDMEEGVEDLIQILIVSLGDCLGL